MLGEQEVNQVDDELLRDLAEFFPLVREEENPFENFTDRLLAMDPIFDDEALLRNVDPHYQFLPHEIVGDTSLSDDVLASASIPIASGS